MKNILRISLLAALASLNAVACGDAGGGDVDEDLGSSELAISQGQGMERYIIKFNHYSQRGAALHAAGAQVALELPDHAATAAYLPAGAAEALAHNPNVDYVELDAPRYAFAQTVPFGISQVQATEPAFSSASGSIKVCIIDSGLYTSHEDLAGIPVTGSPGNLPWNQDACGHGTHVAGTIAAINNTTGVVGVAPNSVNLHIVRLFGDDCAWAYSSTLVAALDLCVQAGAKVVSMSLGGTGKSATEDMAFANAYNAGALTIAAAGNAGTTEISYPAGYASVMSVAAIDSTKALASFSQRNSDVEIAAPGVGVLSTVPWTTPVLTAGGIAYNGGLIDGASAIDASGILVDGGLCDTVGAWSGKVVLCRRGTIAFLDKINNVIAGGGVGAAIYNNAPGSFGGTLGTSTSAIPAISMSMEDGQAIIASGAVGQNASLAAVRIAPGSGYQALDGTSMATPHVSGVAALIWSFNPSWTNVQIRNAMDYTAENLGTAGRDSSFGYGLVHAKAALDYLQSGGAIGGTCGAPGSSCSVGTSCCSGTCSRAKKTCN